MEQVPVVIQRAVPGLDATQFQFLRERTHFLLSWAYVTEKTAVQLLRNSLQVCILPLHAALAARCGQYTRLCMGPSCSEGTTVLHQVVHGLCWITCHTSCTTTLPKQVFDGPEERKKVIDRFALKRQLRELQRLGMPLPCGARQVLHSTDGAPARPSTCPARAPGNAPHACVPLQPLHAGAWVREEIGGSSVGRPHLAKTAAACRLLMEQQCHSSKSAGPASNNAMPDFFRPASGSKAGDGTIAGGGGVMTWRATSPLLSGICDAVPGTVATSGEAGSQSGVQHKQFHKMDVGLALPRDPRDVRIQRDSGIGQCGPDTVVTERTQLHVRHNDKRSSEVSEAAADLCAMHLTEDSPAQPSVLEDERILGQLGEESKQLAEMSKGLLKRAADLLGQSEAFEQAVERAVAQESNIQGAGAGSAQVDTELAAVAIREEHELTQDEQGLLQDLLAAV
eukprot:jgi/Ulvmu1/10470/UM064_0007.1